MNKTEIKNSDIERRDHISIVKSPFYLWTDYRLNVKKTLITNTLLKRFIESFFNEIIKNNNESFDLCSIILKFEFIDQTVRSISKVETINNHTNINELIDLLIGYWSIRTDYYHQKEVINVNLSYRIIKKSKDKKLLKFSNLTPKIKDDNNKLEITTDNNEYRYDGYSIPTHTKVEQWGKIKIQDSNSSLYIESTTPNVYYNIFKYPDHNLIQLFIHKKLILMMKDVFLDQNKNPYYFKRIISADPSQPEKQNEFVYKDGVIIQKKIHRKLQYIKPTTKSLYRMNKFITLDIETKNVNGFLTPICISVFDGESTFSFFIDDYNSEFEMISEAFHVLNKRKYHYSRVYVHNLSYFDGVFLIKYLGRLGKITPLIKHGKIYNIKLAFYDNHKFNTKYVIFIRDSLLILPVSLRKLAINFKVQTLKATFPIHCLKDFPLNYKGEIPDKSYFNNELEYENYKKEHAKTWNLREELIKYCEKDVISLHQVIDKFSYEIFKLYRVDIGKLMSLSSISLAIFRSNYLTDLNIPKINGQMYKDIFLSYKGGIVDMYKPEGNNLVYQDVNSEYPDVMRLDMPGGRVFYFEGNLDLNKHSNFGFFKAEIVANDNLNIPILPVKYLDNTICPIGQWTDWYFSEELKEAQNKYGYRVKILKGYIFERINVFDTFVNELYSKKQNTPKDKPLYLIVKLLLNMLYGRMAMSPEIEQTLLLNYDQSEEYYSNPNITVNDVIDLGYGKELIRFVKNRSNLDLENDSPNISIAIASAIVAYGRIKINQLKYLNGIVVYYSDTDSLITNKSLPDNLIGNKLGQLKIEQKIKKGIFLAPKVYGYITNDLYSDVKIKGLKYPFDFFELYPVLYKNTVLSKYQEKWFRLWSLGTISIQNEIYSLSVTYNKRQLVFDSSNKLINTKPYVLINGEIVNYHFDYIYNIKEPNFKNKLICCPYNNSNKNV